MPASLAKQYPQCYLCNHDRQHEVNKDIKAGKLSKAAIGRKYGCSDRAVGRHEVHLKVQTVQAIPVEELPELSADVMIRDLAGLGNEMKGFLKKELAKRTPSMKKVTQLTREVRAIFELLVKIVLVQRQLDEARPSDVEARDVPPSIERAINKMLKDPELQLKNALPSLPGPEAYIDEQNRN